MDVDGEMSFLVVNCGTSSVKMTLFRCDGQHPKRLIEGHLQHLFSPCPILEINGKSIAATIHSSYITAIEMMIEHFKQAGCTTSSLKAVGHRVVHGGENYIQSTIITPNIEKDLQALSDLAPLHNPPAISGIACTQQFFPRVPQIAVFDTAFHSTLPPKAAFYPIPWELSQKYKIKRYGFHGIAHAVSWKKYAESYGNQGKDRVITVHLGSGCSLAAIRSGVSVDTTMGFTPLDGLMMATRSGELDPAVVSFLCNKEGKPPDEIINLLNHRSGLLGVSCKTADMQTILAQAPDDSQIKLALDMFIYHIQKKIGAFMAVLEGVDAIIFSGGIGENGWEIRQKIAEALSWYSVAIDEKKNQLCTRVNPGEIHCISQPDSKVTLCVVGCDENLFIAEEMTRVLKEEIYI